MKTPDDTPQLTAPELYTGEDGRARFRDRSRSPATRRVLQCARHRQPGGAHARVRIAECLREQIEFESVSNWAEREGLIYTHFRSLVELDAVADGGRRTASTLVHGSRIACHLRLGDREQARMLALQLLQLNPATRSAGDGNYAFAVAVIALAGVHLLPDAEQARVLGPAPAPHERLRGRFRWHILVKSKSARTLSAVADALDRWKGSVKGFQDFRLVIDVDPVDML